MLTSGHGDGWLREGCSSKGMDPQQQQVPLQIRQQREPRDGAPAIAGASAGARRWGPDSSRDGYWRGRRLDVDGRPEDGTCIWISRTAARLSCYGMSIMWIGSHPW